MRVQLLNLVNIRDLNIHLESIDAQLQGSLAYYPLRQTSLALQDNILMFLSHLAEMIEESFPVLNP